MTEKGRKNVDSAAFFEKRGRGLGVSRNIWDGNVGVEYPLLEGRIPPQVELQALKDRIGPKQGMRSLLHSKEMS